MSDLTETQKTILQAAAERTDGSIHPLPERIKGGAAKKVLDSMRRKGLIQSDADTISEAGYQAIGMNIPENTTALATNDIATQDTTVMANDDDATDMATSDTTELANDDDTTEEAATSNEGQDGWTDEPDPEIMALAKKHFPNHTKAEWPAIRNAIEEAYSWGFNDAKAKPKRQTSTGTPKKDSKQSLVVEMLKRPEGATTAQIAEATGWQNHTVRGFLSIAKKKLGLEITTQRTRMVGPNQQGSPGSFTRYFAA